MTENNPDGRSLPPAVLHAEREGSILIATIERPAVRNALNWECWERLDRILTAVEEDAELRALIVTGAGGAFSAGGDMKDAEARGAGLMKGASRLKFLQQILLRLTRSSVPVIAAIEGPAAGVAWSLALTCDLIVASRDAYFLAPFGQRGLVPDGGIAWHLARAVGRHRATEILLGNRRIGAEEAHGYGLVTHLVAPGTARAEALKLAQGLAATSRDTTALTLRMLRATQHGNLDEFLANELTLAALNLHNPDVLAARAAFASGASNKSKK